MSNSNLILLSKGGGIGDEGMGGRLDPSWCTRCSVHVYRGYSELFWIFSSLVSAVISYVGDRGRVRASITMGIEGSEEID